MMPIPRPLAGSAHADENLAHNEGFLLGVASMLGIMRDFGPPGWARYFRANCALTLPDGTVVPIRQLVDVPMAGDSSGLGPAPEWTLEQLRKTEAEG